MRRIKITGRKNRKIKKFESDWKIYTGSSKCLNLDIEIYGKENFEFIIESLHMTKASLSYAEVEKQVKENVLREKMEDGTNKYYNKQISAVKYIPPDETIEESKMKILFS